MTLEPTMPVVDRPADDQWRGDLKVPATGAVSSPIHNGPSARDNRPTRGPLAALGIVSLVLPLAGSLWFDGRTATAAERVTFDTAWPGRLADGFEGQAGPMEGSSGGTVGPAPYGPDRPAGVLEGGRLRHNGEVQEWWAVKAEREAATAKANGIISNDRTGGER